MSNKRKCCKECPWEVRNNNNDKFIDHSKKYNKSHNCHMITNDVWTSKIETECIGYKKYKNEAEKRRK